MKQGRMDLTIYHDAITQGKTAADTIVEAVEGTLAEDYKWIPFQLVPPEKADEFIELQQ